MPPAAVDDSAAPWWVICLCAEWCHVCRDWRSSFNEEAARDPALRFAWIDVEDEAEAMGDIDIETFPTILVARGDEPVFFGPVQPSPAQFARLVSGLVNAAPSSTAEPHVHALMRRLAAAVLPKP